VATESLRDATHFRRIIEARKNLDAAEEELRDAVASAREAGDLDGHRGGIGDHQAGRLTAFWQGCAIL
jgi:hypothetical protein